MQEMRSSRDASVNFVEEQLKGFVEARYVRRCERYFNCYLSSQTGCNKGCRFCHLTATKQTTFEDVTPQGFLDQADEVFGHYLKEKPARLVHFSFMARGEILANQHVLDHGDDIMLSLGRKAVSHGLTPKFNVSTIIPRSLNKSLTDIWKLVTPTIYYSIYSMREDFRRKWMPMAMPPEDALALLREYQENTKKIVKLHYAIIKQENDGYDQAREILDAVDRHKLVCEFNLVRYNPFSAEQGEEADEGHLNGIYELYKSRLHGRAKIIQRIGYDVKASCGMFVE